MRQRRPSTRKIRGSPVTVEVAFGLVLRERRMEKGLTQADLEAMSRVARSYISQLENGQKQVCLRSILQLALTLEMQPGELVDAALKRMDSAERMKLL